jgi:hypothetical protein
VWLEPEDREQAMRRLREITSPVPLPLDSLASLRDTLDDAA